ncbi:MAG TPA: alpha-hydroxy-acid oxidizing protein [Solirubrobacteraceae bacterium]|nr:alpha-hydroxy-acid oxidizing protein [Solirubrobacteraceae bacterium]
MNDESYLSAVCRGSVPGGVVSAAALENAAHTALDPKVFAYIAGGAGDGSTLRSNLREFERWEFVPPILTALAPGNTSTTLFGDTLELPLLIAPIGVLGTVVSQGELALASAARSSMVKMCMSNSASRSIEEVATELHPQRGWFQIYWPQDTELGESFLRRAQHAGFDAIVVTVDNRVQPYRPLAIDHSYSPFMAGEGLGVYLSDPVFNDRLGRDRDSLDAAVELWRQIYPMTNLDWAALKRIRELTPLPLVVKGVMTAEDAERAVDAGADGIVVSNHGGRQCERVAPALRQLPSVVSRVGEKVPVVFDSGIRSGADVLIALALGASAVFIGRPVVWALAVGGAAHAHHYLMCLKAEMRLSMANLGVTRVDQLSGIVRRTASSSD